MNRFFIIFITMVPLLSFAQTKEEAQKILEKTKVHYINVDREFDRQYPVRFLDKDNQVRGYAYLDDTVKSVPYCHINAYRDSYSNYGSYAILMNDLSYNTNIEKLRMRKDGKKVKFYFEQSDPWYEENPVIECGNVNDKDPKDLIKKLYSPTPKYEAIVDGKKTEVRALHPHDPSTCIVAGEEYVKLNKLMQEVTSFAALDLYDRVLIDGKVGTLVRINGDKGYVRFVGEKTSEKFKLFDLQKVAPARNFKYLETIRVLDKKPYAGIVYGQIVENGETKILIMKSNPGSTEIRTIPVSQIMKL